jgi:chemotaxis protein MotB
VRKHKHEDHLNHEAWAIPYADLMTLLLAFFVVMYAVSAVNEGKYRVMSQSMTEAFNGSSHVIAPMPKAGPARNVTPALASPPGESGAAATPMLIPIPARPAPVRMVDSRKPGSKSPPQASVARSVGSQRENLGRIQDQVQHALQPLIDKQMVVVRRTANWLEIEIRTDILFPSGVAQLTHPADAVLNSLAGILAPFPNPLRVEGYTDDKPINTAVYPSNWELSAARAASVARLFSGQGVSPDRMGIIGWGQFRPAADNATVEGRNRNRRVLVVVLSDNATPTRFYSDAEHTGELADNTPAAEVLAPGAGAVAASPQPPAPAPATALPTTRSPAHVPDHAPGTASIVAPAVAPISAAMLPAVSAIEPAVGSTGAITSNPSKPAGATLAPNAALLLSPGARP